MKNVTLRLTFQGLARRLNMLFGAIACLFTGRMEMTIALPEGYSLVRTTGSKTTPISRAEQEFWNHVDSVGKATDEVWNVRRKTHVAMANLGVEAARKSSKANYKFEAEPGFSRLQKFMRRFG